MSLADIIPGVSTFKLVGVAGAVALVTGTGSFLYGSHRGAVAERAAIEAKAAKDAFDRIEKMENENAAFKSLPARDRCLVFMRDSGLPAGACDD